MKRSKCGISTADIGAVLDHDRPMTNIGRRAALIYATAAYASFVIVTLWAICFLADIGEPTRIDGSTPSGGGGSHSAWHALLVDAALLLIFAVQHTVKARARFKQRLVRMMPEIVERSTFVLASSAALGLLFWQWQPMPARVWIVDAQPWAALVWAVYAFGWLIAISATFMVDHLDFLGIRQARWHGAGQYPSPPFTERWLYRWVRHPMMLGLLIAFWATPRMTAGHLFFAAASAAYVAVGIEFEERSLRSQLGESYRDYATRVPALVPGRPRREAKQARVT
jgi:methanethiol S-methyltransferase